MENDEETILQRRKRTVKFSEQEILLILRAYLTHPSKWSEIINDVKANIDQLEQATRNLYSSATNKQLRDRMWTKLSSLMSKRQENIESEPIREKLNDIRNMERQLVHVQPEPQPPQQDNAAAPAVSPAFPNPEQRPAQDPRNEIAAAISNESDQDKEPKP
ncbi:uncharacterized protein LOC132732447 [Ruditapes philippinarum]|uniref:uncharacterized protein LOC132732447 n=1 Tax=Ruditapes philippinarum TaxID=129788 RepID=UPI00295C10EA|nr:uncharacterized protein LOC132732447 [Ruditapes philippinarum]